jgi:hypothetical protein
MKNWIWALAVVLVVGGVVFSQKQSLPRSVPLPQEEDTVRLFFNLIDEGRVTEAVMMMAPESINDDERKQAWGVQWSSFEDIRVVSLEPAAGSLYKVVLETKMKPGSENIQPMPYYGFGNGQFTRWVELEKVNDMWKIRGLATGP